MKTICIDIDGTICSYTEWIDATHFGDIIPGAVEMIRKLHDDNWYIITQLYVIHTNSNFNPRKFSTFV